MAWVAVLPADDEGAARRQAQRWQDERVIQLWTPDAGVVAAMLGLRGPAWDLYLLYEQGISWTSANPPRPVFWMHQLGPASGADPSLRLNRKTLSQQVRRLLEGTPCSTSSVAGGEEATG